MNEKLIQDFILREREVSKKEYDVSWYIFLKDYLGCYMEDQLSIWSRKISILM